MENNMDIDTLKRKRSLLDEGDNSSPPLKALKEQALNGDFQGAAKSVLADAGRRFVQEVIGDDRSSDGLYIGGAWVTNFQEVALDADGNEIPSQRLSKISSSSVPGLSKYGLPTPDPSPLPKDTDPFQQHAGSTSPTSSLPAGLESLSNSAHVGQMKLFGLVPAKIYVYEHVRSVLQPYNEVVKIAPDGPLSLGTFIPSLKGSDWEMIALENSILGFQKEITLDGAFSQINGLYFETDVVFQGALQPVSDFLRDLFHQEKPAIRFSTWLGSGRDYKRPPCPPSFSLRGSLEHVSVNVLDILTFREIGVELTGYQTHHVGEKGSNWGFDYGFFGSLDLTVPGSLLPLQVDYYLRKQARAWVLKLRLQDDEWTDIFGIKGLNLSDVQLEAQVGTFAQERTFSVCIAANLQLRKAHFGVRGSYTKGFYSIEAYIGDLTLQDVGEIFHELVGLEIDAFSHDITLRSMTLCISSEGFALKGEVTVNGHTSVSGGLAFSRDGISVHGGIGDIEFEHVAIKSASLDVFIASKLSTQCARASRVDIFGHVDVHSVQLKAALHTEKAQDGEFRWTIYGEVEGDVTTSKIVPALKDTFLDISLNRLALIASNHSAPSGSYTGINYPVAKGFQFCASIDSIPELEKLMRGSVKGMVFRAALVDGQFALSITFPADRTIMFGDNVYTGPLVIEIAKSDLEFNLILKALLNVKVDTQPDPLEFSLSLTASLSGAAACAQMKTDWTNPCNIGKQVTVRGCALKFGIVYSTFFSTGMPGVIAMAGQIMIGKKEAQVAMQLSQNPKEQILTAAVKDLGVVDFVNFASQICEYDFPKPDGFLHFNDFQLYLSTGASIGETYYPPGASLKGDMTIFGKRAKFDCSIGKMIKIMATIEQFELGPLKVKGATGKDPIVDIEISSSKQVVLIDGAVELWALTAALHLEAEIYPKPKFDFWVDVSLSDWVKLKLEAKLTGDVDFTDLKSLANADFAVYGLMEQHILDNIIDMLDKQINSMSDPAGFDEAKRILSEKENQFYACVQAAQNQYLKAQQTWEAKEQELIFALSQARSEAQNYKQKVENDLLAAEKSYASATIAATAKLDQVRHDAAVAIHLGEIDLQRVQSQSDEAIRQLQTDLNEKRNAFSLNYGSARSDLKQTKSSLQNAITANSMITGEIEEIDRRLAEASLLEMPMLLAEKAARCAEQAVTGAALEAAQLVFNAAELIIEGSEFLAAEGVIAAAETALESHLVSEAVALTAAKSAFDELRLLQEKLVQSAIQALDEVEKHSPELQDRTKAAAILAESEVVMSSMITPAEKAFEDRYNCTEYIAMLSAEKALSTAQSNTLEIELARQACELAEQDSSSFADDILEVGLNIGKWIASAAAEIINITKIEFSGSISSFIADGPPLVVTVEGTLLGEDINLHINWQPHFNLAKFIKAIFSDLWEKIKSAAGKFLEEIGAKAIELVEDVAEAVEELAEEIGEGVEKAAEAIDDAASEVASVLDSAGSAIGHAAEDVVEAVDDAMSDVGSALNDASSAVGHAAEDVAEAVDDAMSDVGSVLNDAGSAVGHAADDVASAFGSAASDVGHVVEDAAVGVKDAFEDAERDVENVANNVGNAISGFFSW